MVIWGSGFAPAGKISREPVISMDVMSTALAALIPADGARFTGCQITEASKEVPCLAMSLKLDMPMIREVLSREEIQVTPVPSDNPAMATGDKDGAPSGPATACRLWSKYVCHRPTGLPRPGRHHKVTLARLIGGFVACTLHACNVHAAC